MRRRASPLGALAAAALLATAPAAQAPLAIRGGTVHTMAGPPIADGIVVIREGRIAAVGPAAEVAVPPGARELSAAVVVPGLIDAHSVVGLAGMLNIPHDQDQLDPTDPIQPELSAEDAYDAREPLIAWIQSFGVTTVHTGHAPAALVPGQTLVAKTRGDTVADAVIVPHAMIAAALGGAALRDEDSPGTRAKAAALLRAELVAAQGYLAKREKAEEDGEPFERDLRREALGRCLRREVPLLVTAQRANDIQTALRIAREFDLRLVLDGAAEAPLLLDELARAQVPIVLHPTMQRAYGDAESLSFETASRLADAGLLFALQSGYESYVPKTRVVLFEAAIAATNGLGFERALRSITLDAARVLGLEERIGSLEVGKDGDVALYDGDPFEYTTHCVGVVIEGEVVNDQPR